MFKIEILTPEQRVYSEEVRSVQASGKHGSFGILSNHAPLFNVLKKGDLKIELADGSKKTIAINGGFLEINNNKLVVLTDSATEK